MIVVKFGGKLNFFSEYGKETTFYFTFPIDEIDKEELK